MRQPLTVLWRKPHPTQKLFSPPSSPPEMAAQEEVISAHQFSIHVVSSIRLCTSSYEGVLSSLDFLPKRERLGEVRVVLK